MLRDGGETKESGKTSSKAERETRKVLGMIEDSHIAAPQEELEIGKDEEEEDRRKLREGNPEEEKKEVRSEEIRESTGDIDNITRTGKVKLTRQPLEVCSAPTVECSLEGGERLSRAKESLEESKILKGESRNKGKTNLRKSWLEKNFN